MVRPRLLTFSTAGTSLSLPAPLPIYPRRTRSAVPFRKVSLSSHRLPRLSSSAAILSPETSILSQPPEFTAASNTTRWMVLMEKPQISGFSKSEIIDYYVETLASVVGSVRDAQMCIYDASWESVFGFCCDIDEKSSRELARTPGVLSVRPDTNPEAGKKDYSHLNPLLTDDSKSISHVPKFSPSGKDNKYWIVQMEKPGVEVVTKAQMVDYYTGILTKVLRNEKDAQVSIYHISREKDLGFCCHIDEECAKDLTDVPGVLSVRPDLRVGSENKDYKGNDATERSEETLPQVKTKRLFVTGLSFYTSEKTVRAAFEGFGELVEVKVIMDKISKRSKGYAFLEYTTEEAAAAALMEMNGKIINGWMIIVDVARSNSPKSVRTRHEETGNVSLNSLS